MIQERIEKIEAEIRSARTMSETTRTELLGLLAGLKSEVGMLGETHDEEAHSITRFADASAHEATRTRRKPELLESATSGLTNSVKEFESSHPELVSIVNRLATTLANMGI